MWDFIKDAGKIVSGAIGAAAAVFTVGSALAGGSGGSSIFSGGWSGAAGAVGDLFGAGSTIGNVVSRGLAYAGYGALAGGALSLLTGDDPLDGMAKGAMTGGIAGAGMGLLGFGQDAATAAGGLTAAGGAGSAVGGVGGAADVAGAAGLPASQAARIGPQMASAAAGGALPTAAGGVPAGGDGLLGWVERNPTLAGHVVSGLGSGLSSMAFADEALDAQEARTRGDLAVQQQRADILAANYRTGQPVPTGLLAQPPTGAMAPGPRFAAADQFGQSAGAPLASETVTGPGRYIYDRRIGRMVYVPDDQQSGVA
ncbi:hypothetical protein [Roseospira goensis]|uniref:Uncharacterized protein n=1 Tax=Roseospira goensis TaxID=391922 RepID=A0A7W6WMK9_9PROT|nr:hypothetical protein [Roseospira goensis]MBB4287612.1 hypothetical protein [Roseospira goensis]